MLVLTFLSAQEDFRAVAMRESNLLAGLSRSTTSHTFAAMVKCSRMLICCLMQVAAELAPAEVEERLGVVELEDVVVGVAAVPRAERKPSW